MEVHVESSSIAAVCGLHHAVLRRVQVRTHALPTYTAFSEKLTVVDIFILNTGVMDIFKDRSKY